MTTSQLRIALEKLDPVGTMDVMWPTEEGFHVEFQQPLLQLGWKVLGRDRHSGKEWTEYVVCIPPQKTWSDLPVEDYAEWEGLQRRNLQEECDEVYYVSEPMWFVELD